MGWGQVCHGEVAAWGGACGSPHDPCGTPWRGGHLRSIRKEPGRGPICGGAVGGVGRWGELSGAGRRGVGGVWGSNCRSNLSPEPAPPASQLSCCFFCPVGTRLGVCVCRPAPLVLGHRGAAAGRAVWCAPPCGGDGERAGRLGSGCRLPAVLSPDGSATRIRVLSPPVPRGGMSPTVGVSAKSHAGPRQHRGLEAPSKPVHTCAHTCTCARLCVHVCAPPPASYTCAHACVGVCGWLGSALGPDACERCSGSTRGLAGAVPAHAACPPPSLATGLA